MTSQEREHGPDWSAALNAGPSSQFGTITLDEEGRVLEWQAEPVLGRSPGECVGISLVRLLFTGDDSATIDAIRLHDALGVDTANVTLSLEVIVGGSRVPVVLYLTTVGPSEQLVRMVLVKRLADDLAERQMQIARERIAALRRLTAAIGHELSNPLSFILNFGQLNAEVAQEIRDEVVAYRDDPSEARERSIGDLVTDLVDSTQIALQHAKRVEVVVKSLLGYVEAYGDRRLVTDINALVADTLDGMGKSAEVSVDRRLDPRPLLAAVDPAGIRRAITEVLTNALEAVAQRDPSRDGVPTVDVSTQLHDGEIEIRVRDNGPGMAPAERARVLEPFFTTRAGREGAGLGLTATEEVLRSHGGRLKIESQVRVGTTVSMTLPAAAIF